MAWEFRVWKCRIHQHLGSRALKFAVLRLRFKLQGVWALYSSSSHHIVITSLHVFSSPEPVDWAGMS